MCTFRVHFPLTTERPVAREDWSTVDTAAEFVHDGTIVFGDLENQWIRYQNAAMIRQHPRYSLTQQKWTQVCQRTINNQQVNASM